MARRHRHRTFVHQQDTFTVNDETFTDGPLPSGWNFLWDKANLDVTMAEYRETMKGIYPVDTLVRFWAVYYHILRVTDFQSQHHYHLMRAGRLPLWKEPANREGGTWQFMCQKSDTEKVWKELLLAAIGEYFYECIARGDEVFGITIFVGDQHDLVQIWNVNASLAPHASVLEKIHRLLPDVTMLDEQYKPHLSHYTYDRR